MNFTDLRLKIQRFFRRTRYIFLVAIIGLAILVTLNTIVKYRPQQVVPETNLDTRASVMDPNVKTPTQVSSSIEELISIYMGYCNKNDFSSAFDMLSEKCQQYMFHNDINEYLQYMYTIMPTPKEYTIQNYSDLTVNGKTYYVYQLKYFDNLIETGLTNTTYAYTTEKITFVREGEGSLQMNVGNFVDFEDIKRLTEGEYLKIDVLTSLVQYSTITYEVKFTNRTDNYIVISDSNEDEEITITLNEETRHPVERPDIILEPHESKTVSIQFTKFFDDSDPVTAISFPNIRVMTKYSGSDAAPEVIEDEKNNAEAKLGMSVGL